LLAFLALLGLLRALEHHEREVGRTGAPRPRASWDLDKPPLRPLLQVRDDADWEEVLAAAAAGISALAEAADFDEEKDLKHPRQEARDLLAKNAVSSTASRRVRSDLLTSLMTDAAIKDEKKEMVDPTPLCLLFGQGHQHFLERLREVPADEAPPARRRGHDAITAVRCLEECLVEPWHRSDPTSSFRWDPEEDVRYALMAGDPTDNAYKGGTQHGANRLAAVGLAALPLAPETRAGRVRPSLPGGAHGRGGFRFTWPIWREPMTLPTIRAMLGHPDLRTPGALARLSVDHVMETRRISIGKFMNFTRALVVG